MFKTEIAEYMNDVCLQFAFIALADFLNVA